MSRPHARLRLACALAVAGIAALLGAAPAVAASAATPPTSAAPGVSTAASPATGALTPLVDCVQDAPLGAVLSRTVVLGYRSTASAPVEVPAGSGGNDVTGGPADRGQPTAFEPGEHHGVWLLTVDAAAEPDLGWLLGGTTVGFGRAPACTNATTTTLSAPSTATSGSTLAATATVSRMLLAAPGTGSVAFSLDGGSAVVVPVSAAGVARADLPVPATGLHTVRADYRPADGSTLLPSSSSVPFTVTPGSAPLAVATDSVVAGSTGVLVTVTRPSASGTASVEVTTADGTARAGADYVATTRTVALADGQTSATVTVPLLARSPGSPAASFFVLLQRADAPVSTASAAVVLPAVPEATAAAADVRGGGRGTAGGGAAGSSSVLPPSDPTAPGPTAAAEAGQDLAMLLGGVLITGGGIAGIVGLVRAAGMRDVRA